MNNAGVCHGDWSNENIHVDSEGTRDIVVMDFKRAWFWQDMGEERRNEDLMAVRESFAF